MRQTDFGSRLDVITRLGVIGLGALLVYSVSREAIFLIWVAIYLGVSLTYGRTLSATQSPLTRQRLWLLMGLSMATSGCFAVMPVYCWITHEMPEMRMMAACAMIGHAMHNLARHTTFTVMAWWDTSLVVGSMLIVGVFEAWHANNPAPALVFLGSSLIISAYFLVAQVTSIRSRQAAKRGREIAIAAQKMKAIGQVTAGVAHDFNNILTVVRGNIELAQLSESDEERADCLDLAYASSGRAAALVSQMMAFVRKSPLRLETVGLSAFMSELERSLSHLMPPNVKAQVVPADPNLVVEADAALLETALINLAINARDAIGTTNGRIKLRTFANDGVAWSGEMPDGPGPFIIFEVRDSGPGIDPELAHSVLEPFFTTKPVGHGSGLGLSMVKGFAEQLGGALSLFNHPSGGLVVQFILPIHAVDQVAP